MTDNLADRKTFRVNGEDVKVFMSFQRLNWLLRILEDPNRLSLITMDPELSEPCIRAVLAKKAMEQFTIDLDDYEIENNTYEEMIIWCRDHLTNFFTKRIQEMADQNASLGPVLAGLQSSLAGSAPLNSSTPVAGPSA